jgi:hypothetical protein
MNFDVQGRFDIQGLCHDCGNGTMEPNPFAKAYFELICPLVYRGNITAREVQQMVHSAESIMNATESLFAQLNETYQNVVALDNKAKRIQPIGIVLICTSVCLGIFFFVACGKICSLSRRRGYTSVSPEP